VSVCQGQENTVQSGTDNAVDQKNFVQHFPWKKCTLYSKKYRRYL